MPSTPVPRFLTRLRFAHALLAATACAWAGCQAAFTVPPEAALDKLLRPVKTSPDSVSLEVYEARIPLDQDEQAEAIWQYVDEQCLDANLRRRLLANGLRAGVVGGTLPDELSKLLGLQSQMPQQTTERLITPESVVPRSTKRFVQVNRQEPRTIQASDVRDEAQILLSDDGHITGKTFRQVEGRYELRAEAIAGQRVIVRLTPELHHGELRNRFSGSDQGTLLIVPSRERETFEQLTMNVTLAAGEMLVVGSLPDSKASLGGVLHTVASKGRSERKFIGVRVLESPESEILAGK
jgi:hypothetical protein